MPHCSTQPKSYGTTDDKLLKFTWAILGTIALNKKLVLTLWPSQYVRENLSGTPGVVVSITLAVRAPVLVLKRKVCVNGSIKLFP